MDVTPKSDTVDRCWPGATVICVGTGPSLTRVDVESCRGQARVIAINDAHRYAPWADVLYAADANWWIAHHGVPSFAGEKYMTMSPTPDGERIVIPGVRRLRPGPYRGLSLKADRLCLGLAGGCNSGYQAINLAVLMGAAKILLLGYDMQQDANRRSHFFGKHPAPLCNASPYELMAKAFLDLVDPLAALGITILNCTRETALTAFERQPLEMALRSEVAA